MSKNFRGWLRFRHDFFNRFVLLFCCLLTQMTELTGCRFIIIIVEIIHELSLLLTHCKYSHKHSITILTGIEIKFYCLFLSCAFRPDLPAVSLHNFRQIANPKTDIAFFRILKFFYLVTNLSKITSMAAWECHCRYRQRKFVIFWSAAAEIIIVPPGEAYAVWSDLSAAG